MEDLYQTMLLHLDELQQKITPLQRELVRQQQGAALEAEYNKRGIPTSEENERMQARVREMTERLLVEVNDSLVTVNTALERLLEYWIED